MLALTVADNLRIGSIPRPVILVAGFVLGTAAGSVLVIGTGSYLDWPPLWGLTWGGLVAFVYFKRRRDEELAAALHATKLAQVDLKRKAVEAELQLMQAHVEPQFLLDTLRRVGKLYETDPLAADRTLESLIVYLRAALPQMRTSSSTLGREVELAKAYLEIEKTCRDDQFDFAFDIPERLAPAMFPPMVVLPLIDALTPRHHSSSDYDGALRAEARSNNGSLDVILTHTGRYDGDTRAKCEEISGRLTALYGADGKLQFDMLEPRGSVATVSVPYVAAA
jgi:LytS/YehU family sensor histidine kinase